MSELSIYEVLRDALRAEELVALVTVTTGPRRRGQAAGAPRRARRSARSATPTSTASSARDALGELEAGLTSTRHYGVHGEAREDTVSVFIEVFAPPPRMVIFGAVDFTARARPTWPRCSATASWCATPRAVFATRQRFPMADEVVNEWPNRYLEKIGDELGPRDAVCVLTHDSKFDVPAIVGSLATRVGYLGAMGSRKTHGKRTERLREAGVTDEELARIHAPIGLDIGARTPEETAVSICAEIIGSRTGRQATALPRRDRADPHVNYGIEGRRAAVAAGSSGLGLATARALADEGVTVAICSRSTRADRRRRGGNRSARHAAGGRRGDGGGCGRVRARRPGRARRRRHPGVQRWRPARGHLRRPPIPPPTGRRSSSTASPTSPCAARRCPRCASSSGGGSWRSPRSASVSRSRA